MSKELISQFNALIEGETDFIANAANLSAFIYDNIPDLNWVGFYMKTGDELLLGPFQGKPACIRIKIGKGVCGTAAFERRTIIVDDVHQFDGHIACDAASNSEIVIPMIKNKVLYGVLDIDSPIFNRFQVHEKNLFEELLSILMKQTNFEKIDKYYDV